MELIPAIDILHGRVVQLVRDDYSAPHDFQLTPTQAARRWMNAGARRLHVVDLLGAKSGQAMRASELSDLLAEITIPIQVSGGIRDCETAERLIALGVGRVILSTAAISSPDVAQAAIQTLGAGRVVVGVHAKNGRVVIDGWTQSTNLTAGDLITQMMACGATQFMYRDVDRDGTLEGPSFDTLIDLNCLTNGNLIVAGGIGSISHLRTLASLGIEAVVLGTSIYTGAIDYGAACAEFHH